MTPRAPHFLLFSESLVPRTGGRASRLRPGQWRFVLEAVDGSSRLEAEDDEPATDESRLNLLAVVRGLESLDQPSRVTVLTPSRYVTRGFRYGLEQWRENEWRWESFGEMMPIRNRDLWERIDHAMRFHQVDCRTWRFDPPERGDSAVVSRKKPSRRMGRRPRHVVRRPHTAFGATRHSGSQGWLDRCLSVVRGLLPRGADSKND
jgi:ribonuclease HI